MSPFRRMAQRLLPVVALTALCLVALQPLLRADLPCSDDIAFHMSSANQIGQLVRSGHVYARWAPDMARGFGIPLYNFYAPLSAYWLAGMRALGLAYPLAANLTLAFLMWASGVGMWLFAREHFGDAGGLLAAVAYVAAPYLAYDVLFRGAVAETSGWMWLPLILMAADRARRCAAGWAVFGAVSYAALILSHNLLALLFSPVLLGYLLLRHLAGERHFGLLVWQTGLIILGGLGLSAFFWLPALVETSQIQLDHVTAVRFTDHFLRPNELLAVPQAVDPSLLNPSPARGIGLVIGGLALLALARLPSLDRAARLLVVGFMLALVAYAALTLTVSRPIWAALPPLRLVQFPWRLLAPAAFCAAGLVGALAPRWGWAGVLSVLIVLADLSWLAPTYCPRDPAQTEAEVRRFTTTMGVDGAREHLPRTVATLADDLGLADAIAHGETPARLPAAQLVDPDPLDARYRIASDQPLTLTYLTHDFPGWTVFLDEQPLEHTPDPDHGLITFRVPAGEHRIRITFGATALRRVSNVASAVALVLLLVAAAIGRRRATPTAGSPAAQLAPRQLLSLTAIGLVVFGLKVVVIDRVPNPLRRPAYNGAQLAYVQNPLTVRMAGGVDLLGYEVSWTGATALEATLLAAVREPIAVPYLPTFYLADEAGLRWSAADTPIPARLRGPHAASRWTPGQYARWTRTVALLPGTPAGTYQLFAVIFDLETLAPDHALGSGETQIHLGAVQVSQPAQLPGLVDLDIQHPVGLRLAEEVTLLGYNLDRVRAAPGESVLATLFWQAERQLAGGLTVEAGLAAADGPPRLVATWPLAAEQPAGSVWRDQQLIRLPADLATATYTWQLRLVGGPALGLGKILVTAPERAFSPPPAVQLVEGGKFGPDIRLYGYTVHPDFPSPGGSVELMLVWKARETPSASYRVFVHLMDSTAQLQAQHDSVPANGARPTTGWLGGEFVVDPHPLQLPADLPAGTYTIYVGLVDLDTNERVRLAGAAADRLLLTTLTVD